MYYTNITNNELQQFHKVVVPNFAIKLTDVLTSDLFHIETIISDSIYRIYPLFYTNEITSTNNNDKILGTECIICQKQTKETYFTFITNPNDEIHDYTDYGSYFTVGDTLTTNQFNCIVSLLRQGTILSENIRIQDTIIGEYGKYEFDIEDTTILDNGIVVSDETITAEPKVKLSNNKFANSTYNLILKVLHFTDVNILDDATDDYKVVDTITVELIADEWVDIPVTDLDKNYVILFDAVVEIQHDKPILQGSWINDIDISSDKAVIQTNEVSDLTATVTDMNEIPIPNKTVYFFKREET